MTSRRDLKYKERPEATAMPPARNITELEREAAAHEQRFESLSRCSPVGILITDAEGRGIYANPKCRQICGFTLQQALDSGWLDFIHPDDRELVNADWLKTVRSGEEYGREVRYRPARGGERWVQIRAAPMIGNDGILSGYVATFEDITERKRTEAERRAVLRRLVGAQEEERRRVARELHDQLGQHLTALTLELKAFEQAIPEASKPSEQLARLRSIANQLMRETNRLAWELRPSTLDDLGLVAALARLAADWSARSDVTVDFLSPPIASRLPADVETALYRVAQEALTNSFRHARARRVSVLLDWQPGQVTLVVDDDGVGFAPVSTTGTLGLTGMRERMEMVGGTLQLESAPGSGTSVYARVPLTTGPKGAS